ncbi:hypothetical protein DFH11DRAFT_1731483 [Phellopilus nigrolimitatus]|nr:hypothetical protein DFH11DRAFT_1731483 [Phellopilus nigrolimitatus]
MDHAHRIGQTKQVYVLRFITENSGRTQLNKAANKDELLKKITIGIEKIINSTETLTVDNGIEKIILRGEERTAELNKSARRNRPRSGAGLHSRGGARADQAPKFNSEIIQSLLGAECYDGDGDMGAVSGVLQLLELMSVLRGDIDESYNG